MVTAPVEPETDMPVPATFEVTPVFVTDTAPVADVFVDKPELVVKDVTPLLLMVIEPAPLEMPIAVPAVNVLLVNPEPFPMSN